VPVSWGEVLDKISILQIKAERIVAEPAAANVARELACLSEVAQHAWQSRHVVGLMEELRSVNTDLWEVEDQIRLCEAHGDFGPHFIQLARAVYQTNDRRAAIKRQINNALGSELVEEKSYADWQAITTHEPATA
jgi:hypothetical protein